MRQVSNIEEKRWHSNEEKIREAKAREYVRCPPLHDVQSGNTRPFSPVVTTTLCTHYMPNIIGFYGQQELRYRYRS